MIKSYRHTGIVVNNINKSEFFYKNLLGLEKVSNIEEKVLKKIKSHNALDRICLCSFNSGTIKKINILEPKIMT